MVVFSAGLPRVYNYFLPKHNRNEGLSIVKKVTSMLFVTGVMFSLFLYIFSDLLADLLSNPDLAPHIRTFSIVPMLLLPTLGIEGVFTSYYMAKYIPLYNVTSRVLIFILIVSPIIYLGNEVQYALYGWIGASILSFLLAIVFFRIPFKGLQMKVSQVKITDLLKYSLPIMGASIAGVAIGASDQFFISRYFGTEEFAEFSNGFIQLPIIGMVAGSAASILMPRVSEMKKKNIENREILNLWSKTLIKSALILFPILIVCLFNAENIIVLVYGELYIQSAPYFMIKLIQGFLSIIIFTPFLLGLGYSKYYMNVHIIGAVTIWLIQYFIAVNFQNPHLIAVSSVSVFFMIVILGLSKVRKIFRTSLIEILPFKSMIKVLIHNFIIGLLLFIIFTNIQKAVHDIFLVAAFALMHLILVHFSSRLINLDYLEPYKPILSKFINR